MADVTVLMVGGRRCGKSSILAAMNSMLLNVPDLGKFVSIKPKGGDDAVALEKKRTKLIDFIEKRQRGIYYLVDFSADRTFSTYTFKVSTPGALFRDFTIEFVDCPGEVFSENPSSAHKETLNRWKSKAIVFLVVVDTPYLMESSRGTFLSVNGVSSITRMFEEVKNKCENDDRKIIFVPVKCEKWKNQLGEVANKLVDYYDFMFQDFMPNWQNLSYSILPVLTAGGIEFGEFSDPQILSVNGIYDKKESCCKRNGMSSILRMRDGSPHVLKPNEGEEVVKNAEYTDVFPGFPNYSWFRNYGKYEPKNCDQIAFQVLRYALSYMLKHRTGGLFSFHPSEEALEGMIHALDSHFIITSDKTKGIVSFVGREQ